jgi:hypothetical protein
LNVCRAAVKNQICSSVVTHRLHHVGFSSSTCWPIIEPY